MTTDIRSATPADMETVRELCRDYRRLLIERAGDRGEAVDAYYPADTFDEFLETLETIHAAPRGKILVATLHGEVVGCGMLTTFQPGLAEMYRVFVDEKARGHNLGRGLCERLFEDARAMGHTSIRLETGRPLTEAISLYTSLGFAEVAPWDTVPPALDGILTAFQMEL